MNKNIFSLLNGSILSSDLPKLEKLYDAILGLTLPSLKREEKKSEFLRKIQERKNFLFAEVHLKKDLDSVFLKESWGSMKLC